jgi:hypothetical protein
MVSNVNFYNMFSFLVSRGWKRFLPIALESSATMVNPENAD